MRSAAVFVDAGYLFAQGSASLAGAPFPRSQLKLNSAAVVAELKRVALEKGEGCRLLRIYWYDGTPSGRLSMDQSALANTDDVKLRLGQINSVGQQKGVDSLIVTDLIELARNGAVSDALLIAGDEDLRVGVQIAQSFGVRIHLLGIEGTRNSQSALLLQEADTTSRWTKNDVEKFLTITAVPLQAKPAQAAVAEKARGKSLNAVASDLAASLDDEQVSKFAVYRKVNRGVPSEFDGKLIAKGRDAIGRDLDQNEKRNLRAEFVEAVKKRKPALFPKA